MSILRPTRRPQQNWSELRPLFYRKRSSCFTTASGASEDRFSIMDARMLRILCERVKQKTWEAVQTSASPTPLEAALIETTRHHTLTHLHLDPLLDAAPEEPASASSDASYRGVRASLLLGTQRAEAGRDEEALKDVTFLLESGRFNDEATVDRLKQRLLMAALQGSERGGWVSDIPARPAVDFPSAPPVREDTTVCSALAAQTVASAALQESRATLEEWHALAPREEDGVILEGM